jgi:hypothetical protein
MSREFDLGPDIKLVLPERSEDYISDGLRYLTEVLCVNKIGEDTDGSGGLGGGYGYGVDFENDTFMLHRFCWCGREDCAWCNGDAPNFEHKKSSSTVSWYKWIGRSIDVDLHTQWEGILQDCFASVGMQASSTREEQR